MGPFSRSTEKANGIDDKELLRLLAKQASEKAKTGPKTSEDRLHLVINAVLDDLED